jgi:hypothetical protein
MSCLLALCHVGIPCVLCTCVYENDLISLVSYTKLPSPRTLCVNAIHKHMFHTCYPKSRPICFEWYSYGVMCIVSSYIFHMIFHLKNFQVSTIGVPCLPMQRKCQSYLVKGVINDCESFALNGITSTHCVVEIREWEHHFP